MENRVFGTGARLLIRGLCPPAPWQSTKPEGHQPLPLEAHLCVAKCEGLLGGFRSTCFRGNLTHAGVITWVSRPTRPTPKDSRAQG